ncbi:MAG TPA: hypothetical protein VFA22_03965 [Stellaceae bacterium]|nr:hypothetical protein [Stellaceae bacterium]
MDARRTLYIATDCGIFGGALNGTLDALRPLGLEAFGRIWSVVVDHRDRGETFRQIAAGLPAVFGLTSLAA